jgi:hypothetical protein
MSFPFLRLLQELSPSVIRAVYCSHACLNLTLGFVQYEQVHQVILGIVRYAFTICSISTAKLGFPDGIPVDIPERPPN